jgi:hypothetical protein
LLMFGGALFVAISVMLTWNIGLWLTMWRGEKWVKELDYIYLSLGCIGVLSSINSLSSVIEKINFEELSAPVFLTTAIVIRFIKTRADIGGWNKLEKWLDATEEEPLRQPLIMGTANPER